MEKDRERSKKYLSTPEGRKKHRVRQYRYLRLRRHMDEALRAIMEEDEILPLPEVADRIWERYKVRMSPSTIEDVLNDYIDRRGTSPLERVDNEYRLNVTFYNGIRRRKLE
jgi:hypothetical protein